MYEQEVAFLATVENPADPTNRRHPLTPQAGEKLRQEFPDIPEEYLAYLREVGPGAVRECQYMIYGAPDWCDEEPLFSWFESGGRKLLVIGDDFAGNLFALDPDDQYRPLELDHETMDVWPFEGGFREFVREKMLLGPDDTDQRGRP